MTAKQRGATYQGNTCNRCSGRERYVSTDRCVPCQRYYVARSIRLNEQRHGQAGNPCAICLEPMLVPYLDEDDSGQDRAWLCQQCNLLLGNARHSRVILQAADAYLAEHLENHP